MKRIALLLLLQLIAVPLFAHCDWIKGPVVLDAKAALEKADATPVLKWIPAANEREVRDAFARTLAVRKTGGEAKDLADRWFFETVVRLHRASEGEPFTGLRDETYTPDEAITMAERALDEKSLDALEKALSAEIAAGLRERFRHALHAKETGGREYVRAYTDFVHYALGMHHAATGGQAHED